jgi:hypothetical protein
MHPDFHAQSSHSCYELQHMQQPKPRGAASNAPNPAVSRGTLAHLRQMISAGQYLIMGQKLTRSANQLILYRFGACQEVWYGACVTPSRQHETRTN